MGSTVGPPSGIEHTNTGLKFEEDASFPIGTCRLELL
jgi:hypothetical protein